MKRTFKQRILQWVYPAFLLSQKLMGKSRISKNEPGAKPHASFYDLKVRLINGKELALEQLKGKKVLIVNTASECGYTAQFAELQKLYQHSKEDLQILAFPSNDFGEQEKGDDSQIEQFCTMNFSVRFPMASKSAVAPSADQHPVYQWLCRPELNGWNSQPPVWNFSKYLVSEEGILTHYFDPAVSPLSEEVIRAVHH